MQPPDNETKLANNVQQVLLFETINHFKSLNTQLVIT